MKNLNSERLSVTAMSEDGSRESVREIEATEGRESLKSAVGSTDMHYVVENLFDDYKRVDYNEIVQMAEKTWRGNAWKGDRASAQLVLWSTNQGQEQVTLSAGDLKGDNNHNIDCSRMSVHFVKTTKAARGNPSQGNPQEIIPDILGSTDPVNIEPFSVQPIWISIDIPKDAAAGWYKGHVTATSASGDSVSFNFELEVLDLTLPDVKDWGFFLDLWQNPYAVARVNNISSDQLWTKAHFDAMKPHYEMLAAAGQKVITTTVTYDPWNAQTYDIYDTMVKWTKKADGTYEFNFDIFDKWVQFMMDLGINKQIDAYSMVSWASKIKYYDELQNQEITEIVSVTDPSWSDMWRAFLGAFVPHLEEKGWLDITYMANDERSLDEMIKAVDLIEEVSGGRLKVSAAMNYNNLNDPRLDRIHNISVGLIYIEHDSKQLYSVSEHRRSLGLITTIYNCVGHYPNSFIRSNPAESVWVIWYTMRHKTDGYLRWAFDSFVENPFETTDFKTWESGDSAQVYPGVLSTVRFERMKEGIRDAIKVNYITEQDSALGEAIEKEIWKMEAVGFAVDPYNGVKDPGKVNIPQTVNRLKAVLDDASKQLIGAVH
ncbi:MAG: glycoside hydrolase domain-containing protein [Bacillota bacterium]